MSDPCAGTLRCDGCEDLVCSECCVYARVDGAVAREVAGLWRRRAPVRKRDYDAIYCCRCYHQRTLR